MLPVVALEVFGVNVAVTMRCAFLVPAPVITYVW